MTRIKVPVKFDGIVEVDVPDHLSSFDKKTLARKLAIAQVVATTDNDDNDMCLEEACAEFIDEADNGTEEDFDAAKADGVCGDWRLAEIIEEIS